MTEGYDYSRMAAVTNRHIFDGYADPKGAFLAQLVRVASVNPQMIVLREKDLSPEEYRELAEAVIALPGGSVSRLLVLHAFPDVAEVLHWPRIHLPLHILKAMHEKEPERLAAFTTIGCSVHSVEDALEALRCGATYCFAGNIYETGSKPGLTGKGLKYLREIAAAVPVPVYGIGGITEEKMPEILETGAAGGCMMSGFMKL